MAPSHSIQFPPPNRQHWSRADDSILKLRYLYWGQRFYGIRPSPFRATGSWCYTMVRSGNPILVTREQEVTLAPRDILITHPELVCCFRDEDKRPCDLIGWQWSEPPLCEACSPPARRFLRWNLEPGPVREMEHLHTSTRKEVACIDEYTNLALQHLRTALDVALARSRGSKGGEPAPSDRFDLAVSWMHEHLHLANPVHHICDYLQISPSTLRRMFLQHVRKAPAMFFQRLKMERARDLLRHTSVKETAYQLGYHYPNDFSKAYKEFFGTNPTAPAKAGRGRKR